MVEATPDNRKPHPGKFVGARLGAVAADDDQPLDLLLPDAGQGFAAPVLRFEFPAAGTAEHGSAPLDDAPHIPRPEGEHVPGDQTGIAVADAENIPAPVEAGPYDSPDGGVHARSVASAGQDGNSFHCSSRCSS